MTETEIERMVVRLRGDNTHYVSMFDQASAVAKSFSDKLVAVSSSVVSTMSNMGSKVSGIIKSMGDTIRNVGLPIGGGVLSKLGGGIETTLSKTTDQLAKYAEGIRAVTKDKSAIHDMFDTKGRANLFIDELSAAEQSVYQFVSQVTGKPVQDLYVTLENGSKEFELWRTEASKLGMVFSGATVERMVEFATTARHLDVALKGFWLNLGDIAAPAIKKWNELVIAAIKIATKWVSENKPLINQVFEIASALAIAGTVITSLGAALVTAGTFLTPFTAALMAIAGALTIVEVRTGEGRRLWDTYKDSLKNVWDATVAYLKPIVAFVQKTFDGVKNAILGGKPELAVQILWHSIQIAWINGLKELDRITGGAFKAIFQNLAAGNWEAAGAAAMNELKMAFDKGLIELETIWATLRVQLNTSMVDVTNFADHFYTEISIAVNKTIARLQEIWAFVATFVKNVALVFASLVLVVAAPFLVIAAVAAWVAKQVLTTFVNMAKALGMVLSVPVDIAVLAATTALKGLGIATEATFDLAAYGATAALGTITELGDKALGISDAITADAKAMESIEKTGHMEEARRKQLRTSEMEKANQKILGDHAARRATLEEEIATIQIEQLRHAEKGQYAAAKALAHKEAFLKAELAQAEAAAKAAKFEVEKIPDLDKVDKDIDKKLKPKTIKIDFKINGLEEVRAGTEKFFELQKRGMEFNASNKVVSDKAKEEAKDKLEAPKGADDYMDPMENYRHINALKVAIAEAAAEAKRNKLRRGAGSSGAFADSVTLGDTEKNKEEDKLPLVGDRIPTPGTAGGMTREEFINGTENDSKENFRNMQGRRTEGADKADKYLEKIAKATEIMAKRDEISFQPAGFV